MPLHIAEVIEIVVALGADVFLIAAVVHQVLVKLFEISFDLTTSKALEFS